VRVPIAILALCLTSCIASEAFPTVIDNRSGHPIVVCYQYKGEDEWSADRDIPAGEAQSLARDHWVQGILHLRIEEAGRVFLVSEPQLSGVRQRCSNSFLTRWWKLAPDCYVSYLGGGRLAASTRPPSGIEDRLNKSLQ
jgi:hypothetical protein